jgi:hypothetical protein
MVKHFCARVCVFVYFIRVFASHIKFQIKQRGLIEIALDSLADIVVEELISSLDINEPARAMHALNISGCYQVTDRGVCDVLGSVKGPSCLVFSHAYTRDKQ